MRVYSGYDESAIMEAMSSAEAEASLQGGGESQSPADSLRMLYYPTYNEDAGGGGDRHEEEGDNDKVPTWTMRFWCVSVF